MLRASRVDPAANARSQQLLLALWDELRRLPGPHLFVLHGVSMWPAVPDGSLLAVRPCRGDELAPGDLVTFRRRATIVTHRVISVDSTGRVIARGDSVLSPDQPIEPEDVFGRATVVRRSSPWGRYDVRLVARRLITALRYRL